MSLPSLEAPARPSLPPLFLAALGAWIAICGAEELTWRMYAGAIEVRGVALGVVGVMLAAVCAVLLGRRIARRRDTGLSFPIVRSGIAIILVAFASAFACGLACWTGWTADVERIPALLEKNATLEVDLTGDAATRDYGRVSTAQVTSGRQVMNVRLVWPDDAEPLFAGHRVAVTGSVSTPKIDDGGRWNHRNGFVGTLWATRVEELGYSPGLRGLVTAFRDDSFARIAAMGGDAAGLLAGVLLGNKTIYANSELEQAFQTTGLAHLMAVSGTHLAIVTMLLSIVLAKTPLRRRARAIMLIGALVIYVAITGFAASALRACTMCSVALVLGMFGKRGYLLSGLSLCVFVFLGLSPPMAFSLGFTLSVLSVLGLVVFGSLASCWLAHAMPRLPTSVSSSVAATIAASFMTLPATIPSFAQLPLISPVANLLAAPLVTTALCLGVLALVIGIVVTPIGTLLLHVAATIASACAALVRILADLPLACLPLSSGAEALAVLFGVGLVALWVAWPLPGRKRLRRSARGPACHIGTLAGTCAVFTFPIVIALLLGFGQLGAVQPSTGARMVMLDVGQGDSLLMQSGGATILVDTGEKGDVLLRELAEQGITHLDAVVISHKDADHAGALAELAGIVAIDHVYVHADLLDEDFMAQVLEAAHWVTNGCGAEGVRPGSVLQAGDFSLTVLAPQDGGTSENDDSLVCLVEYDADRDGRIEARGLLTGDAEKDAVADIVLCVGDIDFLKVAHHGSKGGLSEEQLSALSPEVALIGVGADNKYGHPTKETLRMLEEHRTRIYRTDEQGAISIAFSADGMRVTTEK